MHTRDVTEIPKYSIAVIGDKESIVPFKAFGVACYDCADSEKAKETLKKIIAENYSLIFITEDLAEKVKPLYKEIRFPVIIEIPSWKGTTGLGKTKIKSIVERAVGADIFAGR